MRRTRNSGFTLVELAIVMIIIGLLIGGVLKGQELITNGKITATIEQVNGYTGAFYAFHDMYRFYPGDMTNAENRLPHCMGPPLCASGDGNGRVGKDVTAGANSDSNASGTTAMPDAEAAYMWKHLAAADLIGDVNIEADITVPAWGRTHPASHIGAGGFHVLYNVFESEVAIGHTLRLQLNPALGVSNNFAISPIMAGRLDAKMDDGLPNEGKVTADFSGTDCDRGGVYQNLSELNCTMYFTIE